MSFHHLGAMAQCRMQIEKMQNRLLLNWNVSTLELGIRKWELGISIFCFPFPISSFPSLCTFTRWNVCTLTYIIVVIINEIALIIQQVLVAFWLIHVKPLLNPLNDLLFLFRQLFLL